MRFLLILTLILSRATCCLSQGFIGEAKLPAVDADGFYKIDLSPSLTSHLNNSLSNVRIYDGNDVEVPYILQSEGPVSYAKEFKQYDIVDKRQTKNCCTSLILASPQGHPINNISLSIRNADVTKEARLLGSDDKETWYALKDQFTLSSISNQNNISEIRIVDFPLSNYNYYRIDIADSLTAPLNILAAGYYEGRSQDGKFTEIPGTWIKRDSNSLKRSYLHLQLDTTHIVDRIIVSMKGAPYFLRQAKLYTREAMVNAKSDDKYYYKPLSTFVLSSKQSSVIELEADLAQDLLLIIENKDNPPLEAGSIKAYQLNRYLTAWLKGGETYSLKFGPADLRAPVYDIEYFQDSIPAGIKTLNASPFTQFSKQTEEPSKTFFTSKVFVWVAIIVVMGILGFMAMKMAREV